MNSKTCNECGNRIGLKKTSDGTILCKSCIDERLPVSEPSIVAEGHHIIGNIFLGSEKCAADFNFIQKHNISKILVVGSLIECHFEENPFLTYKVIQLLDESSQNIRASFEECFGFIQESLASNENILIHCVAGMSRSATIVIAFLMKHRNLSLRKAFDFVQNKRPIINPNFGFMKQLRNFEEELQSQRCWQICSQFQQEEIEIWGE